MKFLVFLSFFVAATQADVSHIVGKNEAAGPGANVPILKQAFDLEADGTYQWNFEAGNGIVQSEQGALKGEVQSVQGSAKWTSPEGEEIELTYIADENGYQPVGKHLPTPPPIPEAILKALEFIKQNPPAEDPANK